MWNGSNNGGFYNVDKFENGKITQITIPRNSIPSEFENKDIIFQYDKKGNIKMREDLKEKSIFGIFILYFIFIYFFIFY